MEIFLDKKFLNLFLENYNEKNELHRNLRRFFSSAEMGIVFINIDLSSKDQFIDDLKRNLFFEEIISVKSVTPDLNFKSRCLKVDFYDKGSASKYLFVEDVDIELLQNKYGVMAFNFETINKASWLFTITTIPIDKRENSPSNWTFISKFRHPFNSLVLTDSYLYDYRSSEMELNLFQLLKGLLPAKLDVKFHLSIVGFNTQKNIDLNIKLNELQVFLKNEFKYEISIRLIADNVHDRNLLTNYLWISSGIGFSIFNSNKTLKNDSMFTIVPITLHTNKYMSFEQEEMVSNTFYKSYKNIVAKCKHFNNRANLRTVGVQENRILN
jgi:hypothetical protein